MASSPTPTRLRRAAARGRTAAVAALTALLLVGGCSAAEERGTGEAVRTVDAAPPEQVVAGITESGLRDRLEELAAATNGSVGFRSVGSDGYDRAAEVVRQRLTQAGWSVTEDVFDAPTVVDDGRSVVEVAGHRFGADAVRPLLLSPPGDVTGPVVAVGGAPGPQETPGAGCSGDDDAGLPTGAVVLVPPGGCFRRDQLLAAQEAGAAALVTYSPAVPDDVLLRPTLARAEGLTIPGVWVTQEVAAALGAAAGAGESVHLSATAVTEQRPTRSVIGELPGGDAVVMLGAHLDSVLDGPGLNDDGSGVAALLEIVRALGSEPRAATVRVGFWSGEEVGLLGSSRYVEGLSDDARQAVVVYGNADMIASPNGYAGVYDEPRAAPGSDTAGNLLREAVERAGGTPVAADVSGSSDHFPFTLAGVPTTGVFSGAVEDVTADQAAASGARAGEPADPCYHQACDELHDLDLGLGRLLTAALADFTVRVADDPGVLGTGRDR
jgi:hypothetical protein